MLDYFALLSTPRQPWLNLDSLKQTFFTLSAELHPDRVHTADAAEKHTANERSAELNAAYQCLRAPRERLRHLLELELGAKPSDLTQVPEDLMDLFFAIGKEFRTVDALLVEKNQATSPKRKRATKPRCKFGRRFKIRILSVHAYGRNDYAKPKGRRA